ncbi:HNH endonuclease [Rhizobium sp. AG855]|nr:HNH endonuclease [Rhizobium sp. AG855]
MRVQKAANFCIYCGAGAARLTNEHVFPYAFGGELVLPRSSCAECAKKTSQLELFILRRVFGKTRTKLQMRSRRPDKRPHRYPITLMMADGSQRDQYVSGDEYPFHCTLPTYPPARALRGKLPSESEEIRIGVWSICDEEEVQRLRLKYGAADISLHMMDLNSSVLCRFLAKMAHGYAFATETQDYVPLTREFILGGELDPNFLVGCEDAIKFEPHSDAGLFLRTWTSRTFYPGFVVAFIQFFPSTDAPVYHVLVGMMPHVVTRPQSAK